MAAAARRPGELEWRPLQHDAPRGQDHDAVGHPLCLAELVRGQHYAHSLLAQPCNDGTHRETPFGVDAGGRLVEERHGRTAHQRQRQRQALLLAAREMAPRRRGHPLQPREVEQLVRRPRLGVVAGEEVEDPPRPEHRVHPASLEHHAHARGQRGVVGPRIEPEHPHAPRRRPPVALDRLDRRRLPRAVGPQHDEDLAGLRVQVQRVDGRPRSTAVAHGEPADLDGWHGVAGYFGRK